MGLVAFSVEMTNKGKGKGKEVAGKGSAGKRKAVFYDDKTGVGRKRNKPGVLQFFDDAADVEESDFSDFSDDDSDFGIQSISLPALSNLLLHFFVYYCSLAKIVRVLATFLRFVQLEK